MNEPIFDDDRLDVYRLSIDDVAAAFDVCKSLRGSLKDRARFFGIDRGSLKRGIGFQPVVLSELTGWKPIPQ